jgi:hypothetical protein
MLFLPTSQTEPIGSGGTSPFAGWLAVEVTKGAIMQIEKTDETPLQPLRLLGESDGAAGVCVDGVCQVPQAVLPQTGGEE